MALEKKKNLRRIEFTFTDGEVHPQCHCVYENTIMEDGVELMRKNHREVEDIDQHIEKIKNAKRYVHRNS